jgi:hypothetical protein
MKQKSIMKAVTARLALLALLVGGSLFGVTSAKAADLPTIRVSTPTFSAQNETFANDGLGQYYAAGGRSYFKYVGAGSTITVTYVVTTNGTAPSANKAVTFMVNAPYSGSNATWEINGKAVGPTVNENAGLTVAGTTDSDGKVSFTIKNTNTAASAMEIPSSETQGRATSGRVFGNMKLSIDGLNDMQQIMDLITFDITKSPASTITGAETPAVVKVPSMRLVSPVYSKANSIDTTGDIAQYYSEKTRAWATYIAAGTTVTLKYFVTKDGVTPWANKEVSILVNAPYSGSKATWSSGSKAISAPAAVNETFGAELKKKTDSKGYVTFSLKNTNTTNLENAPTAQNQALDKVTPARLFGTIKPIIPGYGDKSSDTDLVTFDIHKVMAKTKIKCVSGKSTKTVIAIWPTCPSGYTLSK